MKSPITAGHNLGVPEERLTLLSVIRDHLQVDEVRPDDGRLDGVIGPQLDLDALAERREHFGEDQLLVPHGRVAVFLHRGFSLKHISGEFRHLLHK